MDQTVQTNDNPLRTDYVRSVFNGMVDNEVHYAVAATQGNRRRDFNVSIAVTLLVPDMTSLDIGSLELKYTETDEASLGAICTVLNAAAGNGTPVTTHVVGFGDNQHVVIGVHSEELDTDDRLWVAKHFLGARLERVLNIVAKESAAEVPTSGVEPQSTGTVAAEG